MSSPQLTFLQQNAAQIARVLDLDALSQSIVDAFTTGQRTNATSKDGLLWLLAHFIALNRSVPTSQSSKYLEALYLQLSLVASDVRLRSSLTEEDDEDDEDENPSDINTRRSIRELGPLPPYISSQLEFLVNEDGISALLSRFTS